MQLGCYYILPIKVFSSEINSWLELLCVFQFESRLPPLHLCFCCQGSRELWELLCCLPGVCLYRWTPKEPSQTVNQLNNQPEATHFGLHISQNIRKERCHLKKIFQSSDIWPRGHLIATEQLLIFLVIKHLPGSGLCFQLLWIQSKLGAQGPLTSLGNVFFLPCQNQLHCSIPVSSSSVFSTVFTMGTLCNSWGAAWSSKQHLETPPWKI